MEIFKTIWTALTTENELLTIIFLMPETFLETYIYMLLFLTLLNVNSSRKIKIKYILIVSIISNILNLIIPNPFRSFLVLVLIFLCIKLLFKTSIIKTILATIIPIFFTVLCEAFIVKLFAFYFNLNMEHFTSVPLYRLGFALIIEFVLFIIYLLIKYFKIHISVLENMSKKNKVILVINFIVAILAMTIQFIITGFYMINLPWYIVIFSNITLIAYFILSIYSLTKTTQLEVTALDLAQEKEHNKMLKLMQDDLHGFRHDFSNILCTIGGYVQVSDMEGLQKYYSQIQKDINKVNTLGTLNPDVINNPAVFALISSKYNLALEDNIEMNINIFLDLNTLNMKIYEFTRILGILLDNSIQAARECDEKIINIEIRKDTKRNRQLLIVENTYNNKDIDTDKIYEKNYSTKPGNSGLGLWEVRQILKKNNNLNLFTSKTEKFFKQQLEMYNI